MRELKRYKTFDELSTWYDYKYIDMGDGWECPREVALDYLAFMGITQKNEQALLLDVGCGAGHFIQTASEFVDCEGIDISKVAVVMAKERVPHCEFYVDNIETFNELLLYDYIVSLGSIEHTLDIPKALEKIYNLLTDDGIAFILVPNEEWLHLDQPNETTHTDIEWRKLFEDADLEVTKFERRGDISLFLLKK